METGLAEIFGIVALIVAVTAHQMANPKAGLYLLCLASLGWSAHFFILGEVAFIIAFLNALRNISAAKLNHQQMVFIVATCFLASSIYILFNFTKSTDLLPIVGAFITSLATLNRNNRFKFRILYFAGECVWLLYAIIIISAPLALASLFFMSSIIVSIVRHDFFILKKKIRSDLL